MKPDEAKILQKGDRVRVLQPAASPHNTILSVLEDELLTFISLEGELGWAFCMNADFKQGSVPITNLVLATQSSGATLPCPPVVQRSETPPPPPPRHSQLTLPTKGFPLYDNDWKMMEEMKAASVYEYESPDCDALHPVLRPKAGQTPPYGGGTLVFGDATSDPGLYDNNYIEEHPPPHSRSESEAYFCVTTPIQGDQRGGLRADVGDVIKVLKSQSQGLVIGQSFQTLEQGVIPRKFLRPVTPLDLKPWYVGQKSRFEAEGLLKDQPNTFLVRESDANLVLSMSVRWQTEPFRHRLINRKEKQFYAWPGHNFDSIDDLISKHGTLPYDKNIGMPFNKFSHGMTPGSLSRLASSAPAEYIVPEKTIYGKVYVEKTPNRDLQRWFIQKEKIKTVKELGSGCYGQVMMAMLTDCGSKVAVKTFKAGTMNVEDFENEAIAMKDLRHPYLVKLLGVSEMTSNTQSIFIVMEYIENGSLEDYCKKQYSRPLGEAKKAVIAKNVASGMNYLSSQDYIHRDLAARNVLLTSDFTAKIADFGLAKCIKSARKSGLDHRMPWKWSAPEVIGQNKDWTTKCDVWSFGVFCWELYTDCQTPYFDIRDVRTLLDYLQKDRRLEIDKKWPKPIQKVMKKCWKIPLETRTDFQKIEGVFRELK